MIEVRGIAQVVAETRRKMAACFTALPQSIPARRKSVIRTMGGSDD